MHTDTNANIKLPYSQRFPKNLMEYSQKVDNKFLNDNLATIEEINQKDSNHWIPEWVKNYQNKIYGDSDILNHDNFFKATLHDTWRECYEKGIPFPKVSGAYRPMSIQNAGFLGSSIPPPPPPPVPGALISIGSNTSGGPQQANLKIWCTRIIGQATLNNLYNSITASPYQRKGYWKLGCYDESSNMPGAVLAESSSQTLKYGGIGANWISVTQFAITTPNIWLCLNLSHSSARFYYGGGGEVRFAYLPWGAAFPATPGVGGNQGFSIHQQVRHG